MNKNAQRPKAVRLVASTAVVGALTMLPVAPALAADHLAPAPATMTAQLAMADVAAGTTALAATPWRTTGAVDQDGAAVELSDPRAAAFVGDAYFKADGTFAMYELSGAPKMHGLWEMRDVDGQLVRWIRALDDSGATRFERLVDIVCLDGAEFTYRVADASNAAQWVDIVHTPMSDPEPGASAVDIAGATSALAATPWRTTGAVDQDGAAVVLDDARAAAFVGDAYFEADGTFAMYELSGAPKMHGLWEMRDVDGQLVRWIRALDDSGATRFERIVEIVKLDGAEFTYRVVDASNPAQWVDIVHTPMSDPEPGTDVLEGETPENETPETPGNGDNDANDNDANGDDAGSNDKAGSNDNADSSGNADETQSIDAVVGSDAKAGDPDSLEVTGSNSAFTALMASIAALLGGGVLFASRMLKRRSG